MPFGGSDAFTLPASADVYAGLYCDASAAGSRMPMGFDDGTGSSFIRFTGANAPLVGMPISGGSEGTFPRACDFSITVESTPAAAVPEPATLALLVCGLAAARTARGAGRRGRARQQALAS